MSKESTDVTRLQSAVQDMDSFAQEGLAEIIAMSKIALSAMESPSNQPGMDTLARIFSAIWMRSEHLAGCIASEAHGVGCASEDEAALRRTKAFIASQKAV